MKQTQLILNHLKSGKSITALEALKKFDCFRCAARIRDLKDMGHKIDKVMIQDNGKRYASYFLKTT